MNPQDSLIDKDNLQEQIKPEETVQETTIQPTANTEVQEEVTETVAEEIAASEETTTTEESTAPTEEKATVETEAADPDDDLLVATVEEEDDDDEMLDEEIDNVVEIAEMTKSVLVARLKELVTLEVEEVKDEVETIKQQFYKKSKIETEKQKAEFIANGGEEIDFIPNTPELETEFKELLGEFKAKKAKLAAELEKQRENNLLRKNHIIEQIKVLVESKEDVSANINTFRQLQQEWKNTGAVPPSAENELWRAYNQQQEAFWDLIKINNELREYDFRKNLEAKTKLIEAAETLDAEQDVVSAFRQLQKLHEEWRELGPVARDLREEVWGKFKAASTVINRKHQAHFDEIRAMEEKNLEKKNELCEQLEAIDTAKLTTFKDWENTTKEVLELQEQWRTIGFAPRKANQKVYQRYRAACDKFFAAKGEFYKEVKNTLAENLEKKKALCEKAEALKDSTNWKVTTDEFIKIQKEWKTIGPVQKKYSDEVWKRFITACDYFFEQRNKNVSSKRGEELKNLEMKKAIIEKIKAFTKTDNPSETLAALRTLAAEWNAVGHVPYRDKDKIYKEYRTALDAQFDALNIDASQRRLESFRSNLKDMSGKGESKLYREREKLVRAYENLKNEILTYENNMGFLSISSKKGGGMLQEMERKIEALKEECKLLEQKINMIDENI
ncbi:MAG TPA: DUF349 domain-containing protein [Bacteroidales bacterium]|nr:DUF349 domain-containing protein [Bacteroidales bacterium]